MKTHLVLRALLLVGTISSSNASRAQTPQPQSKNVAVALDAPARAAVVQTIATAAERQYVDAAAGLKIAAELKQRLASGGYDSLSDPEAFATALTRDMRDAVPDVHLRAVYEPSRAERGVTQIIMRVDSPQASPAPYTRIDGRSTAQIAATNFGFEKVERLSGNVGYLKLSKFVPLQLSRAAADKAMTALRGADAVIIDLRGVPGGSPDLVVQLVSYFASSQPVRLMTTYDRGLDRTDELWSLAQVPGGRLTGVPLYVLQDADTASAAEMFSYFVQRQKLGTVVGETSAGAGNGGTMLPVGSNISLFLPQKRIVDGPGWEAIGIVPEIATRGEDALNAA